MPNAITQAAYHGVTVQGGTLYTTCSPCLTCTKMIINAGLVEVVFNVDYPLGETPLDLLREAGVKVRQVTLGEACRHLDDLGDGCVAADSNGDIGGLGAGSFDRPADGFTHRLGIHNCLFVYRTRRSGLCRIGLDAKAFSALRELDELH